VRLLDRTTRRVRPTEAGAAFYRRCRRLLDDAAEARSEAQATQQEPAGRLVIAAPDAFAERYMVPGLPAFLTRYPTVEIALLEGSSPAKLVQEGIDLAIRIAEKPEANLVVRRIATSRIVLVASPNYLAQAGSPRSPHDLLAHSLIGFEPLAWRDTWRVGGETLTVRPRVLSRSGESLRAAAIAGLGIAAVPDWLVADALVGGHVTRVLEGSALPRAGIFAVYPTNRLLTPKVRAYVDHLVRDLKARGLSR